jgi:hypothetical protein
VTHLDKGTRGVSANADLLVGHHKLTKPVLIQVKACEPQNQGNVFMGAFREGPLYNSKPDFHADFIMSVAITSLKDYRIFVLPVGLTDRVLAEVYKKFHLLRTKKNEARKPVPTMYVPMRLRKNVHHFDHATKMLLDH